MTKPTRTLCIAKRSGIHAMPRLVLRLVSRRGTPTVDRLATFRSRTVVRRQHETLKKRRSLDRQMARLDETVDPVADSPKEYGRVDHSTPIKRKLVFSSPDISPVSENGESDASRASTPEAPPKKQLFRRVDYVTNTWPSFDGFGVRLPMQPGEFNHVTKWIPIDPEESESDNEEEDIDS